MDSIGLGTYMLKGNECYNSILKALAHGYRLFDTAILYKNQKDVGRAIKDSGIERNQIFITSKVHFTYIESATVPQAITVILNELQVDYVDLLLLHKPDPTHNAANWKDMITIRSQGKARHIGTSNFLMKDICEIVEATGVYPYVNQIEFNPLCQRTELVAYCKNNSILVQAFRSFGMGKCIENDIVRSVSVKLQLSPAQVILLWTWRKGIHVIPMSCKEEEMKENIHIRSLNHDMPELEELDGLNENYYTMPRYADI